MELVQSPVEIIPAACSASSQDVDALWSKQREGTIASLEKEPMVRPLLMSRILVHSYIGAAMASLLASKLATTEMPQDSWGFKALQTHRAAHMLWLADRKFLALQLQSRSSELYGVDIHPNAVIGPGLLLDHGTGVVIGETARLGSNCIILHGVTLGGVGKHIKDISDAHCTVSAGDGAKVGSASVVLKSVPARCTAVGSPARIIGRSHHIQEAPQQQPPADIYSSVGTDPTPNENLYSVVYLRTWTLWADCVNIFDVLNDDPDALISLETAVKLWASKVKVSEMNIPIHFLQRAFAEIGANPVGGMVDAKKLEIAIISHIKSIEDSYHYSYQI